MSMVEMVMVRENCDMIFLAACIATALKLTGTHYDVCAQSWCQNLAQDNSIELFYDFV